MWRPEQSETPGVTCKRWMLLSLNQLFLHAGKKVCNGAEHQECADEADFGAAAAVHQPAGKAPKSRW